MFASGALPFYVFSFFLDLFRSLNYLKNKEGIIEGQEGRGGRYITPPPRPNNASKPQMPRPCRRSNIPTRNFNKNQDVLRTENKIN